MYIVSPLSRCASVEKRDRFLNYIADIAPVAYENEPHCIGYAWFRSTEDNDTIPLHWCRGFEVYASPEASRVAHRASEQYKVFRHAVGTEALLESPSDLEFWRSTDIGFLTKDGPSIFFPKEMKEEQQYIVTDEIAVPVASIDALIEQLRKIAETARLQSTVETCWVLKRNLDEHGSANFDNNVYVLLRFQSREAYELYRRTTSRADWDIVSQLAVQRRTTTWEEAGIGFLGK